MREKIKKWMMGQDLESYTDYSGSEMYTDLAIDAINHFDFEDYSEEYDMCFDLAVDVLDS